MLTVLKLYLGTAEALNMFVLLLPGLADPGVCLNKGKGSKFSFSIRKKNLKGVFLERILTITFSFNRICNILGFYSYRSKTSTHTKMNLLLLKTLREVWQAFSSCSCTLVLPMRYGAKSGKKTIIREKGRAQFALKDRPVAPANFRRHVTEISPLIAFEIGDVKTVF